MVLPLVIGKDTPILRTVCQKVTVFDESLAQTIANMKETMLNPQDGGVTGIGIAAPQVGIDMRILILTLNVNSNKENRVLAMVNPEIVWESPARVTLEEGCLSLPKVFGNVKRPAKVKCQWQNVKGEKCERKFEGWDARILQHELDHLDGVLFIDYLKK